MRLQYDEARRKLSSLKVRLANIEDQMIPGQSQCDKDRYAHPALMASVFDRV